MPASLCRAAEYQSRSTLAWDSQRTVDRVSISKSAKARFGLMSASEKATIKKAAKTLFDAELMGAKRAKEITRWAEKR